MGKINFSFVLSLELAATVKIATTFFSQADVQNLYIRLCSERSSSYPAERLEPVEQKVKEKVLQLKKLPKHLTERVIGVIKPLSLQIFNWFNYHQRFLSIYHEQEQLDMLCWTPLGTIDWKKTAISMIRHQESMSDSECFHLASVYALEEHIQRLWNQKVCPYYIEDDESLDTEDALLVFWVLSLRDLEKLNRIIERKMQRRCSRFQFALEFVSKGGNRVAAEYFLQKLSREEKDECLVRCIWFLAENFPDDDDYSQFTFPDFPSVFYPEALHFLLSQIDEKHQKEALTSHPFVILKCFLGWPFQGYFTEIADRVWEFLTEEEFLDLLIYITDKMAVGYKDYNYQKLFRTFWRNSPQTHKEYAKDEMVNGHDILLDLADCDGLETVKMIFDGLSLEQKEKFVCTSAFVFDAFIERDRLDLLRFFIRESISSKTSLVKFKEELFEYGLRYSGMESEETTKRRNAVLKLLDNFQWNENSQAEDLCNCLI